MCLYNFKPILQQVEDEGFLKQLMIFTCPLGEQMEFFFVNCSTTCNPNFSHEYGCDDTVIAFFGGQYVWY